MGTRLVALIILWRSDMAIRRYGAAKGFRLIVARTRRWKRWINRFFHTRHGKTSSQIAKLVARAKWAHTIYHSRALCLPRSLSMGCFLVLNGVDDVRIRIGVHRYPPRLFHAWVEVGGEVIGDGQTWVPDYVPIMEFYSRGQESLGIVG